MSQSAENIEEAEKCESDQAEKTKKVKEGNEISATVDSLREEVSKKETEIAQLKEQILRARADFDNFRKKMCKNGRYQQKTRSKGYRIGYY